MNRFDRINRNTIDLRNDEAFDLDLLFHNAVYTPETDTSKLLHHDFLYVFQIIEGSCVHCVSDKVIPCKAGDIHIVRPNVPHGFFLLEDGQTPIINQLVFSESDWFFGDVADADHPHFCYGVLENHSRMVCARLDGTTSAEIERLYNCIESELAEKQAEWREVARGCLIQLFVSIKRYIGTCIKSDSSVISPQWEIVNSAKRIIKERYSESNLTLKIISEMLFISESHLSRMFKGVTGKNISDYLRDVRIENICKLLRETDLKVEEIVVSCGMLNLPSFYRNFYERMNMTPRQYRRLNAKENAEEDQDRRYLKKIAENFQSGKSKTVKELIELALNEGVQPEKILNEGLLSGMNVISEKFKNNEVYVPEVLVAAKAMNEGMQILKPVLEKSRTQSLGKICIGTVRGDLHDIGKNLVKMMMEGKGLEVVDLGTDVPPEAFVNAAVEQNCQVICCSALLTTTMNVMEDVVKAVEEAGIRNKVKIMIGGGPVTQEFCEKIGADCYTVDAASAADAAVAFLKEFQSKKTKNIYTRSQAMAELTERERILRTYRRQEVDRIPMLDKAWEGTKRRWYAEGMPQNMWWEDYFGFDHEIQVCPDNSPRYVCKTLEENDRYKIVTSSWGSTKKVFRELDSTPETLDFYYDTPEKWEEAKQAMLTYHEDRIPWEYLKKNYPKWKAEGRFIQLMLWFGFDVAHSRMTGTENMLITMLEDPDWAMDIYDTYLKTSLDLCQKILDAGYEFDGVFWYDDMGYKGTPFFSAQTYRDLLKPYHKKAVDWAHERGMVAELHSCGFIEPLLPDILETGVDMLNPLEIKAGMDPQKLKATYGDKIGFHGGINAQLWDDIDLVKAEMERIIPMMKEGGGYIFASDHSIPNSVSFENMKEISELAHRLGKY